MEETHTCGGCGCSGREESAETEACSCEGTGTCSGGLCDVEFNVSEDAKFATLLMLMPMLTLSAFNMMGLL